ncbi:UvrABC system protein C [Capnocytophaga catalasegens]|uniref:UvrABC system protein C n=1 Tax=Capnocytophaga catalasegens TaxID=1004260 RepID=A0AAV5ASV2_9FLAO|nr:UvrABC system protein C [Capnocytophaga catalasegens]GJM49654.1 UvrABC system protein C [Capnocytophaga catalasegens]GJM52719.1 UvrABC system protein C [Capnocytophaga catalasegens]
MKPIPIEIQIQTLPDTPGIYQFFDENDKILYVGKAKNLKKRVSSYFSKLHESSKTRVLVKKIVTIRHIIVETENDALLLENNLIKKLQPRYNILLKDDKSYPWICIKNERFPRVFFTRRIIKDGSLYFGPYTNLKVVRTLLDLIKELYPLRTCSHELSVQNIKNKKFKVCLEYHIKNCKGPCEDLQSEEEYNEYIRQIKEILKGNLRDVISHFKEEMNAHAQTFRFEEAQDIKEKMQSLENYQAKSTIVSSKIHNIDVFSIVSDEEYGYVNFLQVAYGAIIRAHTIEMKKKLDETDREMLEWAIMDIRERFSSTSKEIIVPFPLTIAENLQLTIPKQGEKFQLLQLSQRNAQMYRQERFKQVKIIDPERHTNRILTRMQADLHLSVPPRHIECFDNSNIQGTNPVAACVVFKDTKPSKKDYRHFNIKSVEGPNDFASMEEVVYRRYKRLLEENAPLPQLIVIDGGKGQLSSAVKSLETLGLRGKIAIIGIAKRLEEIFYPEDSIPLYLDKKSETLKIIQQLRNEAHRFGITFHRQKRSNTAIISELDQIKGIGEQTKTALLSHFKSVKRIKEASLEDIIQIVGRSRAQKVFDGLAKL